MPTPSALLPGPVPRPDRADTGARRYLQSYLLMRLAIGLLGIALPVVLVIGDLVLTGDVPMRGSLSAYYFSGGRDFFVGAMVATGLFLLTYRAFERSWENVLSGLAGFSAIMVALFPTSGGDPLTPLQERLGEDVTAVVHYGFAALFIGSLAAISVIFGRREGQRTDPDAARATRGFWRNTHYALAGVIVVAVVVILARLLGENSLFMGEVVAVVAFGLSWLLKGTELSRVHLPREMPQASVDPPADPDPQRLDVGPRLPSHDDAVGSGEGGAPSREQV